MRRFIIITLAVITHAFYSLAIGAPDFSLVGFAAGVTGGEGGKVVAPKNASEFKSYCQSSEKLVIQLTGKIDNASASIESNKTILGIGASGELTATTLSISDGSNIIIRNVSIHHAAKGKDIISISGGTNIWIDHCDIYNAIGDLNGDGVVDTVGDISGGDVDWYDGLIDMTKTSQNITISWNRIHDSFKAMLVGSSDSDNKDRKVTFHHNHFFKLWERVPSYRGGTGHIFNNYYADIDHSAVNCRVGATLRIEGNVFENTGSGAIDKKTKIPWGPIGAYYSSTVGCWDVKDNVYNHCKGNQPDTSTCTFAPPYDYTKVFQPSSQVKETVLEWAGVGKLSNIGIAPKQPLASLSGRPFTPIHETDAIYNCRGEKISAVKVRHASGVYFVKCRSGALVRLNRLNR